MKVRSTRLAISSTFCTPFCKSSGKRNTPQCACMVRRRSFSTSTTRSPEVAPSRRARRARVASPASMQRSEEHTSELQSHSDLVCRLLLEKKKNIVPTGLSNLCADQLLDTPHVAMFVVDVVVWDQGGTDDVSH